MQIRSLLTVVKLIHRRTSFVNCEKQTGRYGTKIRLQELILTYFVRKKPFPRLPGHESYTLPLCHAGRGRMSTDGQTGGWTGGRIDRGLVTGRTDEWTDRQTDNQF